MRESQARMGNGHWRSGKSGEATGALTPWHTSACMTWLPQTPGQAWQGTQNQPIFTRHSALRVREQTFSFDQAWHDCFPWVSVQQQPSDGGVFLLEAICSWSWGGVAESSCRPRRSDLRSALLPLLWLVIYGYQELSPRLSSFCWVRGLARAARIPPAQLLGTFGAHGRMVSQRWRESGARSRSDRVKAEYALPVAKRFSSGRSALLISSKLMDGLRRCLRHLLSQYRFSREEQMMSPFIDVV